MEEAGGTRTQLTVYRLRAEPAGSGRREKKNGDVPTAAMKPRPVHLPDPAAPLRITAEKFARVRLDPALQDRRTTSDYIAAALRAAIYDGQFADGAEFNQVELSNHFGVSRVPLREALRQLQAEGLVQNVAHHKTVVVGLALPEIMQLVEVRAVLEAHLVKRSGPLLDDKTMRRLRELCREMGRISNYGYDWVTRNWEFHRLIYRPSGARAIIDLIEQMNLKVERYTRRAGRAERLKRAAAEHRQIVARLARADYAGAAKLLERHILNTGAEIKAHYAASGR